MTVAHPEADPVLRERDWTIAERLDEIEQALKREPDKDVRRVLTRQYLDLTDPEPKELDR